MADQSQGPGWWQASDMRWYPPHLHPHAQWAAQQMQRTQQAKMMRRQDMTHRMAQGAMIGWAVGVMIAFALAAWFSWWLVGDADFDN